MKEFRRTLDEWKPTWLLAKASMSRALAAGTLAITAKAFPKREWRALRLPKVGVGSEVNLRAV